MSLPLRFSLVAQTVSVLRKGLAAGKWIHCLPSEQELCSELHISRTTLRLALAQLQHEGLLRSGQGRRRQIVQDVRSPRPRRRSNRVILLTPHPLRSGMPPFAMFWMDELRKHLADAGYHLDIRISLNCFLPRPAHALADLAACLRPAAWVLFRSTAPMQHWFAQNGLPFVITGSRHPGVPALSVDVSYRASCRHAASRFLHKGHRRLALLISQTNLAGDIESEEGFKDGARSVRGIEAEVTIARHNGTVAGIQDKLELLLAQSNPPTAFLISTAYDALTVLGHLTRRGLRVPQDIAMISRDDESFLRHTVPMVTRYVVNPTLFAGKISRVVLALARTGVVRSHDYRLIPSLIQGETLD